MFASIALTTALVASGGGSGSSSKDNVSVN